MSRSGYCDDLEQRDLAMYRGRVMSAIRGKRGQAFLIELRDALDAMPEKRLIPHELVDEDGEVCALGAVGKKRQIPNLDKIDPEAHDQLSNTFNVAECLIREIEFENDEQNYGTTPEKRWEYMRRWVDRHIKQ